MNTPNTKIAISERKAAFACFEAGLSVDETQEILEGIKESSRGFYYANDVLKAVGEHILSN